MEVINYGVLHLLELDQVERQCDIMKASDLCQNRHIFTGDSNYGFYYEFEKDEYDGLITLGAEIETFKNVSILRFTDKKQFLDYCNSHKYIDTMTILKSGYPERDYYFILRTKVNVPKMKLTKDQKNIIASGIANLKEFGYPDANSSNIFTDKIYSEFFKSMLSDNIRGCKNDVILADLLYIEELINEIN